MCAPRWSWACIVAGLAWGCAAQPPVVVPPTQAPAVVEPPPPAPIEPEPVAVEPAPIQPMPQVACVEVRGLGRTADGFVQVGGALADDEGLFALQWICRGEDWRLRLQRCASGCGSESPAGPEWEDVAELVLGPLRQDEVLVFGAGACSQAGATSSASAPATLVARAARSSLEKLPSIHNAWRAALKPPFSFLEIPPTGIECLNPDYGL